MRETSNWYNSMPNESSQNKASSRKITQKSNGTSSRAKSREKLIDIHIGTDNYEKRISTSNSRTTKSQLTNKRISGKVIGWDEKTRRSN